MFLNRNQRTLRKQKNKTKNKTKQQQKNTRKISFTRFLSHFKNSSLAWTLLNKIFQKQPFDLIRNSGCCNFVQKIWKSPQAQERVFSRTPPLSLFKFHETLPSCKKVRKFLEAVLAKNFEQPNIMTNKLEVLQGKLKNS